uniref:PHD-type domain-containing protein n=1 Tax=Mesocestoides corti TaxID=53468 RepID=A0A5K3FID6_MESCO
MDPRNLGAQQNPLPLPNNPQSSYMQSPINKFGSNGHAAYMQQPMRQPGFHVPPRMGRNVVTVGPMTGKLQQESLGEFSTDGLLPMQNQSMGPNLNMSGDSIPGSCQRGPPLYQHQTPPLMMPNSGVRGPQIPPQQPQTMFNQMSSQIPMEMLHQQRFQPPQPPSGSRFPGMSPPGQHPAEVNMMGPMSTPEAGPMPPIGHPSPYDVGFGVKSIPGNSSVSRQLPSQQQFTSQQLNISSPIPLSQSLQQHQQQQAPIMSMRSMEIPDATRQPTRQIPVELQHQQSLQIPTGHQTLGTVPPLPPPGPATQFPVPTQGTLCSLCSRDLAGPPAPTPLSPKSPPTLLPSQYPPVQCEAGCREWFHLSCSGLTPEAFYLLKSEGPLVEWLCTPCATRTYPNIPYIRLRH